MTGKELADALHSGRHVFGTAIISDSPRWVESVAAVGLDLVFIDTEHIAIDRKTLSWMCHAYRANGIVPIVRIPRPDHFLATMALDGGACGIIAPYVESAEQVRTIVGAVKYRPLRGRKLERILNGEETMSPELAEYVKDRNKDRLVIINVESVPSVENLDALLAVAGVDAVLVGPHDLSCSVERPEKYSDPLFEQAIETIIKKSRAHGVGVGVHAGHDGAAAQQISWIKKGVNLVIHSADITLFTRMLKKELALIKEATGQKAEYGESREDVV